MGDSYTYSDDGSGLAAFAFLVVLLPILLLSIVAGYVISSFFFMKIFEKAGVQGKWRAWVPIYNALIAAKLGDLSPWVYLIAVLVSGVLSNIPVIGFVFGLVGVAAAILFSWRLGLKFGKDWPWLLLWLIPGVGYFIWLGILAFGSARFNPAIPPAPWANTFLADKTVWEGVPVQPSQPVAGSGGPAYGAPPAPPAQGYTPPSTGTTPPPPAGPQA